MNITTVGADLAKDIITVYAPDAAGRVVEVRDLRRKDFSAWLIQLPKGCVVGMEACSGAHQWARVMHGFGLTPKIMAAEFVKSSRKNRSSKNDRNDAEAICTAVRQPNMRFVTVKSVEQQTRLAWHRVREGWKEERTALINRTRGLLAEFGLVIARGSGAFDRGLAALIHDEAQPASLRGLLEPLQRELAALDEQLALCDRTIAEQARSSVGAQRIQALTGVGVLTADAITANAADARDFKNARQFAAWQGLAPRQYSSGGKTKLGHISRRGDAYLRTLLVQGARSCVRVALKREPAHLTRIEQWIMKLYLRVGYNKTLVAVANKHARMIWAILAKGEAYDANAWQRYQVGASR